MVVKNLTLKEVIKELNLPEEIVTSIKENTNENPQIEVKVISNIPYKEKNREIKNLKTYLMAKLQNSILVSDRESWIEVKTLKKFINSWNGDEITEIHFEEGYISEVDYDPTDGLYGGEWETEKEYYLKEVIDGYYNSRNFGDIKYLIYKEISSYECKFIVKDENRIIEITITNIYNDQISIVKVEIYKNKEK